MNTEYKTVHMQKVPSGVSMIMKAKTIIVLLIICCVLLKSPVAARQSDDPCQRVVLTLLAPLIQEQIEDYYKSKLTVSPTFAPYMEDALVEIKYFISHIDVKVTLNPYVGPHIDVGKDEIYFRMNNSGRVDILDYHHIKDYKLPHNWEFIYR